MIKIVCVVIQNCKRFQLRSFDQCCCAVRRMNVVNMANHTYANPHTHTHTCGHAFGLHVRSIDTISKIDRSCTSKLQCAHCIYRILITKCPVAMERANSGWCPPSIILCAPTAIRSLECPVRPLLATDGFVLPPQPFKGHIQSLL